MEIAHLKITHRPHALSRERFEVHLVHFDVLYLKSAILRSIILRLIRRRWYSAKHGIRIISVGLQAVETELSSFDYFFTGQYAAP
uniref:Uncharacterized protein n=1 Tax=Romanomermis culicivorax TaxID=13658 RepID=A0A915IYG3_ROMCU